MTEGLTYRTDVDYDAIKDLAFPELVQVIAKDFRDPNYEIPGRRVETIAGIMQLLSKYLGLQLSNEQYIFMLSNVRRLLCEATAGAGKTTVAQLALFVEKIANGVPGEQILCLTYNASARSLTAEKHAAFALRINGLKEVPQLQVSTTVSEKTIHSFCKEWINQYYDRLGLERDGFVLDEGDSIMAMRHAAEVAVVNYNAAIPPGGKPIQPYDTDPQKLNSVYNYINETLLWDEPERWCEAPPYNDLYSYPLQVIQTIFKYYTTALKAQGKYGFSDWMGLMYTLMQDPQILARIRRNYKVMLVDEFQDITPAMMRLIHMFTEGDPEQGLPPYPECRLIAIGDNDQSIYRFRGTDPYNCMRFAEMFGNGNSTRIVTMSINRRSRHKILEKAKTVIEANEERIAKPLVAFKEGGIIKHHEYTSLQHQATMVINQLSKLPAKQLSDVCICYRNNSSAMFIAMELLAAKLPFRIMSGDQPFSDKLSKSVLGILELLTHPADKVVMKKYLYQVLPKSEAFNRKYLESLINAAPADTKFWELSAKVKVTVPKGYAEAMETLGFCYKAMRLKSLSGGSSQRVSDMMSTYVHKVIELIKTYYFDYQNRDKNTGEKLLSEEYVRYIEHFFTRPISYETFLQEWQEIMKSASGANGGMYLSTFHSLKGQEFSYVIIIDMDDGIFPGVDLKIKGNPQNIRQAQQVALAEAHRLFYVAMTRAIDSLTVYFSLENPSRFIRFFKDTPDVLRIHRQGNSLFEETGDFVSVDSMDVLATDIAGISELERAPLPSDNDAPAPKFGTYPAVEGKAIPPTVTNDDDMGFNSLEEMMAAPNTEISVVPTENTDEDFGDFSVGAADDFGDFSGGAGATEVFVGAPTGEMTPEAALAQSISPAQAALLQQKPRVQSVLERISWNRLQNAGQEANK